MTTTEPQPDAAAAKPRPFQFSLRTLFVAVTLVAVFLGYAVSYGLGVALLLGGLTSFVCVWVVRACRRWRTLPLRQRVYAGIEGALLGGLLAALVVTFALDPSFVRQRNARHLQRVLNHDDRFSSVHVEYLERKLSFLRVDGQVASDADIHALREMIRSYDWRDMHAIYWNVSVVSSPYEYKGWNRDLFGD